MNEDLISKFEQFEPGQLWVMVRCFGSPKKTLLYQHALAALERSNPDMAGRLKEQRKRVDERVHSVEVA